MITVAADLLTPAAHRELSPSELKKAYTPKPAWSQHFGELIDF